MLATIFRASPGNLVGKFDRNINFARINMKTFCKINVSIPEI